ncbi:hypothetical protein NQZ68_004815 [Dissostichus eleginoides]|nr:hypothetical protein NQZ68_004815 [Dissostichus eleginoides]
MEQSFVSRVAGQKTLGVRAAEQKAKSLDISPQSPRAETGASVIHCRALRCRRLNVNQTGNLGNRWARLHYTTPTPYSRPLIGRMTENQKSSQIHRWSRAEMGSCTEPNKQ